MEFKSNSIISQPEILKRKLGSELLVPVTVSSTDASSNPVTLVKAGSPLDSTGKIANTGSAVGILLNDVYPQVNPNGSLVKAFATINKDVAESYTSLTYSSAMKAALPNIIFE